MPDAPDQAELDALWARHSAEWRDPAQITAQWEDAASVDPTLLRFRVRGAWWETLAALDATLIVTREYEHLVMAMTVIDGEPHQSYLKLPHPSGLAVDESRGIIHVASTRNPNQVYDLAPITGYLPRLDMNYGVLNDDTSAPLTPIRSRFFPGCFYMHDLALIGGRLHANSVGQNAVVRLDDDGRFERVWWPRCIETDHGPVFGQNHIQLNSIAAGDTPETSFYSASADKISARRPGHKNFPVDKRGVIFSGATREVYARGLTRPHSARWHNGQVWVDNSGYGELGYARDGKFQPVLKLPGWTRGLGFRGDYAFVGTSRVIPRFRQYAPGLNVEKSVCGLHAVDLRTGEVAGSLLWPAGNQIFAIELVPRSFTSGFVFPVGLRRSDDKIKRLFYSYLTQPTGNTGNLHE
jgi:uncharacterized protein (TIGR03032 family)